MATKKKKKKATKKKKASKKKASKKKASKKKASKKKRPRRKAKGSGLKLKEKLTLACGKKVYDADFHGVHVAYIPAKSKAEATSRAKRVIRKMVK